jgi:hypothetical protein
MNVQKLRFTLSGDLKDQVARGMATPDAYSAVRIPAIAATLHKKTGLEAFLLGFDYSNRVPREFLRDNDGQLFAMLMTPEQADKFTDKCVVSVDGYLELTDTLRT